MIPLIRVLETSRGNPYMEPETSTIKQYSRGGTCLVVTFFGGWSIRRK